MALRELSKSETEELLSEQRIVRVAFDAVRERYLVPLGYVWFEGSLCAVTTHGRKTRIAKDNPQVSFQLDDSAETGLFGWKSVSGEGTFEFVTDPAEIDRISRALFGRFPDIPEWGPRGICRKGGFWGTDLGSHPAYENDREGVSWAKEYIVKAVVCFRSFRASRLTKHSSSAAGTSWSSPSALTCLRAGA
jgi:nitroimidazol reductase NimA-like FMN-containing flavoprotein (pyridoxamine 5'-phosphate oxidase superfamily)